MIFFIKSWMFLELFVFAKKMKFLSLCDNRNRFASVCIKHGVFQSRRSKRRVTVASHRLATTTKYTTFPSELGFVC